MPLFGANGLLCHKSLPPQGGPGKTEVAGNHRGRKNSWTTYSASSPNSQQTRLAHQMDPNGPSHPSCDPFSGLPQKIGLRSPPFRKHHSEGVRGGAGRKADAAHIVRPGPCRDTHRCRGGWSPPMSHPVPLLVPRGHLGMEGLPLDRSGNAFVPRSPGLSMLVVPLLSPSKGQHVFRTDGGRRALGHIAGTYSGFLILGMLRIIQRTSQSNCLSQNVEHHEHPHGDILRHHATPSHLFNSKKWNQERVAGKSFKGRVVELIAVDSELIFE